jgi:hypothetical protein
MTLALIVDADTVSDQLSGTSTTTGAFIDLHQLIQMFAQTAGMAVTP